MKTLQETYFRESSDGLVTIYRAQPAFTNIIRTNDYVTLSRKFAIEHAVTSAVYNEEPFFVVMKTVPKDKIKEADNPGEYRWMGDDIKATPVEIADEHGEVKRAPRESRRIRAEAYIQEIDQEESLGYYKELSLKDEELFNELEKLTAIIIRMRRAGKTPGEATNTIHSWLTRFPDLNPLKSGDTLGIKMFIDNLVDDPEEAGNVKRYYDDLLNALLKQRYE